MTIRAFDDHFAEVDSDAELDALILRLAGVPLRHSALDIDRALDRVDDAGELRQKAVAHEFKNFATMLDDRWLDEFNPMSF